MNKAESINERLSYRIASRRVQEVKNFYMRLGVYCIVNMILLIIWIFDTSIPNDFWIYTPFFTAVLAGLLIVSNAVTLYGHKYILPKNWEERKLREFLDKEKQQTIKYE